MKENRQVVLANAGIMFIAVSWGLNFSVIKWALSDITPMYYLTFRFILSGLVLLVIFAKRFKKIEKENLKCGILAGILLSVSFAAQTIGLQYTSPGKAGFLANACVVIMPFLMWIIYKKRPGILTVAGAFIAFLGLAIISLTETFSVQFGDLLQLLCAFSFAGQTMIIDRYADVIDPIKMTVIQMGTAGIITLSVAVATEPFNVLLTGGMPAVIAIGYGVIFCTAVSFIIQGYAQRVTKPSNVAIILCFEAVFAYIFSLLLGYDTLSMRNIVGSMIVMIGFIISQKE